MNALIDIYKDDGFRLAQIRSLLLHKFRALPELAAGLYQAWRRQSRGADGVFINFLALALLFFAVWLLNNTDLEEATKSLVSNVVSIILT